MSAFPGFRTPPYIRYHPSFFHKTMSPHPAHVTPYNNRNYGVNYNDYESKSNDSNNYRKPDNYRNQNHNNRQNSYKQDYNKSYNETKKEEPKKEERKKNTEKDDDKIIEIFGLKLHTDDILIIGLLLYLYQDGIQDQELFISLVLLLIT